VNSAAVNMVNRLMYFLYKNEYRVFMPVDITIRRRLR
jgi:hypothetical protein